ncbi:holo-ACP synthase CitX [Lacrimispora amygdalina]|uniref:citrate lyase holo-[acyl-carrier protein] synthase n=1 Tax=Lacrimispora amygdalina TaxID=253257 RepID=A0A3E2NDV8_9FIRM|nr:citrate lyase holo-[acyl-carrier protein] synthase [Clostridium indicum]RFZ79182.1 citrate lyase holo-[acyl-carrier protein] synthase [Clostridium indicum]
MERYVDLEEMLSFREKKVRIQEELRKKHKGMVTMALAMNIPGPVKTSPDILLAFEEGTKMLEQAVSDAGVRMKEMNVVSENAGYIKFYALDCTDAAAVKGLAVRLEENHPLGRLWDIDVYDKEGFSISRESLLSPVRKCLICGQDAKGCARNRSHSVEELYREVERLIHVWKSEKKSD